MTDLDVQDLNDDLNEVDDDDDEFEDEDQISPALADLAREYEVNPSDYDTEAQVSQAIRTSIAKIQSGATNVSPKKEEQITLASLKVLIDDDENELDPRLKKALEKIASTSNENNDKIIKMLQEKVKDSGGSDKMQKQIDQLQAKLQAADERHYYGILDAWIAEDPERQKYFGKGRIAAMDQDGKYARRRRVCFKKANKYAAQQKGRFTVEKMFKLGYKSMVGSPKKAPEKNTSDDGEGTPLSRADGGGQKDFSASDNTAEALKRKSHENANKLMRTRS